MSERTLIVTDIMEIGVNGNIALDLLIRLSSVEASPSAQLACLSSQLHCLPLSLPLRVRVQNGENQCMCLGDSVRFCVRAPVCPCFYYLIYLCTSSFSCNIQPLSLWRACFTVRYLPGSVAM